MEKKGGMKKNIGMKKSDKGFWYRKVIFFMVITGVAFLAAKLYEKEMSKRGNWKNMPKGQRKIYMVARETLGPIAWFINEYNACKLTLFYFPCCCSCAR